MFTLDMKVRLHDTDAAGVLFFANYFKFAHDAYEQFMESIGFDFRNMIDKSSYLILIVNAESNFHKPMYAGDIIKVVVKTKKIGHTSYVLNYEISNNDGEITATVKTTHVAIDKISHKPVALPEKLIEELKNIIS